MFAMVARIQMKEHGATLEDFAEISVKNHNNACLNPYAQYQKKLTVEEILNSRTICDPITLLMCCPNTDGGAAAILCSMDIARQFTTTANKGYWFLASERYLQGIPKGYYRLSGGQKGS